MSQSSGAIVLGWTIIRDVFNMLFIFVLIYSAIAIMLNLSSWNGKQMLTKVIIAAVLINFSFFFTEVIIDAGNIIGEWFYQGIQNTIGANGSISASISAALGVWTSQNTTSDVWGLVSTTLTGGFTDSTGRLIAAFVRLGIIGFTSYIFIYVSVLFLARAVSLLFSLVLSPLGFAGGILPQTKKYADKWRGELIKDILLAPVFLLFLYVIIAFVNSNIFTATGTLSASIFTPSAALPQAVGQYFKYFLLAGMLLYALKATKEQSSALGESLEGLGKQLAQAAAGVTMGVATGGASLALRSTVGAAGSMLANSDTVKGMAGSNNRITSALGSSLRTTGTWTSKQNFDASKTVSKSFGVNIPKSLQAETGKGKTGYAGLQKAREDAAIETAKFIGPNKDQVDLVEGEVRKKTANYDEQIERTRTDLKNGEANKGSEEYKFFEKQLADLEEKKKNVRNEVIMGEGAKDAKLKGAYERLNNYATTAEKGSGFNPNSLASPVVGAGVKGAVGTAGLVAKMFEKMGVDSAKDFTKDFTKGLSEGFAKATAAPDKKLAEKIRNIKGIREDEESDKSFEKLTKKVKEEDGGGGGKPKDEKPEGEAK